jgi:hypothetical protein
MTYMPTVYSVQYDFLLLLEALCQALWEKGEGSVISFLLQIERGRLVAILL